MHLLHSAQMILDQVDPENTESNFRASVGLQVEVANIDLLPGHIVIDVKPYDVFGTALDVGHGKKVWANGGCWLKTGPKAHETQ